MSGKARFRMVLTMNEAKLRLVEKEETRIAKYFSTMAGHLWEEL